MRTVLYLLRHAESAPAPDIPFADYPLSERGTSQAEHLATTLADLDVEVVVSSPWPRATATIAPFAAAAGLEPRLDDRLVERYMGEAWLGDWEAEVRRSFEDPGYRPTPECESLAECDLRTASALADIVTRGAGRRHLLCMHGQNLVLALRRAMPEAGFSSWRELDFGALRRIDHVDGVFVPPGGSAPQSG